MEVYDPVYSEIRKRLQLLAIYPLMGKALPSRLSGWRATIVRMFRIIYRPIEGGIEVAYVRHCKRKSPSAPQTRK